MSGSAAGNPGRPVPVESLLDEDDFAVLRDESGYPALEGLEAIVRERAATTHDHAPLVSPGSKCPTCERRIPHPKKDTSPQTKVVSIRVPIDDAETFKEMLEAAASHLGLLEKPHSNYWTVLHGLVLSLQGHGEEG